MSVLITVPDPKQPGGVAGYYVTLKDHLRNAEYFTVGSRPAIRERGGGLVRLLKDYWRFYRQLKVRKPDLVHLNPSLRHKALLRDGVLLLLAKFLRCPVLVFVHGWSHTCEQAIRRRYLLLFRLVYSRADAFVVLASRFQSALRDFGYDKPVYLERTAVSDDVFLRGVTRSIPSGSEGDRLNILFLSRIEKTKGIYEAIEAFRIVRQKYPFVTMTIAGDGGELANARQYVGQKNIRGIRFLGWVDGVAKREAFAAADIYLFPTFWGEGMPISVLEAMAYGLPVITCPDGGIPDFFQDGKMGFMTDSRDPEVFASLVERLALDPHLRRAMGQHNHSFARTNFTASIVAGRLINIYDKTIHETPHR